MRGHDYQRYIEKAINVQADVIRIKKRLVGCDPKVADKYAGWIQVLETASDIYNALAAEENSAWSIHLKRSRLNI